METPDASDIFFDKYYNLALWYLSFRQRSEKEIRDYLHKKKVQDSLIKIIINKLKEHKFLNDEEFARVWVESRIRAKPRAWRLIKIELKQKGISDEIIESTDKSLGDRVQNDVEMAKRIVEKKISKYKSLPKQEVYQKLGMGLAAKGFNWDTIRQAIDDVYKNEV